MTPITPQKRKGWMGPPSSSSPFTPSSITPRSVITTPRTGSSSTGRGRSETPFRVKTEPVDPPSPSPRMSRAPSTLPPMSPMSRAMVPYRASTSTPSPSRKRSLGMLRDMSPAFSDNQFASPGPSIPRSRASSSRYRYPSEAPSMARSRRPSSTRSTSTFSLAESEAVFRMGRSRTEDHDKRTRNVRPRESREGSASTVPAAVPSLPPLPITISEPATMITSIIEDLFVQDIDAEEGSGEKDKEEFKEDCLKLIMEHLFDGAGLAERILHALAEEELILGVRQVNRLLDVLRSGAEDILASFIKDFPTDGSKKSKVARQSAWYAKYRAAIPGLSGLLKDMSKNDAVTIISLLAQEWSTSLTIFHTKLTAQSVNAKKGNCRNITESIRRLSDVLVGDVYHDK